MSTNETPAVIERAVTVTPVDGSTVEPAAWAERFERLRSFCGDDHEQRLLRTTARDLHLTDAAGATWRFDGGQWERHEGARWRSGTPAAPLRLEAFTLDYPLAPDAELDPEADAKARVATHGSPGTAEFLRSFYGLSGGLRVLLDRRPGRAAVTGALMLVSRAARKLGTRRRGAP